MKESVVGFVAAAVVAVTTSVGSAFSPADLKGLELWLDASVSNAVVLADGKVSQWKDCSTNRFHAGQQVGEFRPTFVEGAFNGMPMVRFAANHDDQYGGHYLRTDCIPASGGAYGGGARTIIIAVANVKPTSWHVNHVVHYGSPYSRQAYGITCRGGHVSTWGNHYWQGGFDTKVSSTNAGGVIVVASYSDGADHFTINGGTTVTNEILLDTAAGTYGKYGMIIGARIDPVYGKTTEGAALDMGEVMAFSTALSVEDRQMIEGYLAHKWGMVDKLPAGHPYKSSKPETDIK
ncbi:MAG: hypothetical protein WCL44_04935 [bacterium]